MGEEGGYKKIEGGRPGRIIDIDFEK